MRSSAASLALAAALLGCASTAPPPAHDPAAPPSAASQADILVTEDGLVRVPRPQGDGWDCRAQHVASDSPPVVASFVGCARRTSQGSIILMAKDYKVPKDSVLDAKELSTNEYPRHYHKRYERVTYTRSGLADHHGHPAWDVAIKLERQGSPTLHVVERVAVAGTHVINISATGPVDDFPSIEAEVKRWFNGAEFASLMSRGEVATR
jgi:hypothetical protein